jgi:4-aminobutyrate aminotransferase / (S)-3-amino-2-methylpropionate transaminase / 5-aminovalerate transaminase
MGASVPQQRHLATAIPGPKSTDLFTRRNRVVPRGVGTTLPVFIASAGGGILTDVDGNRLIDFGAGIAVVGVGNASPGVVRAVREQVERFTHTCFTVTPYESYVAVCEALNRLTPGDHDKKSFLVNSGAEAVENAVKIARTATNRPAVVTFDHAFHGRTLLTMSLTAKITYKVGGPFAPEVHRLPFAYPYRCPTRGPDSASGDQEASCAASCAAYAMDYIDRNIGAANIAAVVAEPVQGEGGVVVPAAGFLPTIAEYCRGHGIVFIADEVQTGFGRTGTLFASEHEGLVPDLVTTAKGIAGGLPLGGVTGRAELMDAASPGGLGGTFGGNPLACVAALAAIEQIERDGLVARSAQIGQTLLSRLAATASRQEVIGDVRGRGAMVGVELVSDRATKTPAPELATRVMKAAHEQGLLLLLAGSYDNVLRIVPPLVIEEHLLEDGLTILDKAFATL